MRLLAFGLLLSLGGVALGDASVEVSLAVSTPAKGAPQIEATIVGAAKLPVDKLAISSGNVSIKATKVRSYAEGTEPIAVAIVVSGQEIWVGNDEVETDDQARHTGALHGLASGFDKSKLTAVGPKGSQGEVISYAAGAQIRVPMGELGKLTGKALGAQKDAYKKLGSDLVAGVELALAELHKTTVPRRALIVIGDGNDTNNEAAKAKLVELKKQAARDHVQLFAVVYKAELSDPATVITTLVPAATTVTSTDGMAAAFTTIADRLADRYYVTFPGYDPKSRQGLPWDGKAHDLVVHLDHDAAEAVTVTLAPVWTAK